MLDGADTAPTAKIVGKSGGPPPLPPGRKVRKGEPLEAEPLEGQSVQSAAGAEQMAAAEPKGKADDSGQPDREDVATVLEQHGGFSAREMVRSATAFLVSMAVHLLLLVVLGMLMIEGVEQVLPSSLVVSVDPPERDEEELTVELDQNLDPSVEVSSSATALAATAMGLGEPGEMSSQPSLDQTVSEQVKGPSVNFDANIGLPTGDRMIQAVPENAKGDAREIVDNLDEAMDRITQEILLQLAKRNVLLIWCFDESESMKDEQHEIRQRVHRVYTELGLTDKAQGKALLTAVTSYGENFHVLTREPTSDVSKIRLAMDQIPIDASGLESMCTSIGQSMAVHEKWASRRKVMLICVTDESGEMANNEQFVEPAIQKAQSLGASLYFLGRESVFGYPYAFMRWRHPETTRIHWLRINRGPETAFVEQLQTNGFRRRHDAHPSGFGPYEQARMARETGGIFFMLPSLESNLVRGEKRRYELEAMRAYHPDLRARSEVAADRDASPFRTGITKVIYDLNPYNPKAAEVIEMRIHYSREPKEFAQQVQKELTKAKIYITYLDAAEKAFEQLEPLRQREYSPRWQANFDLLFGQILAYKVRIYEYGAYLEQFMREPKVVPLTKPPNLTMVHWDITTRKETLTGEQTSSYIDRANVRFEKVIADHPGTPWAARARQEMRRGYGVHLVPDYEPPYPKPSGKIKIPKL